MAKILKKEQLSNDVYRYVVEASAIAKKRKAGQFIILRLDENGERIPLTIVRSDADAGWVELIVQAVGKTTKQMAAMNVGDNILDLVGPLGVPIHVEKKGTVVMIGGGVGIAPLYSIALANHEAGNKLITILGARNKDLIILKNEMAAISDEFIIATDDGSEGMKGLVTDALQQIIDRGEDIKEVVAIGPLVMMKFVSLLTKKYSIPTTVSLNTIMIDGTGMCGGCRVTVGGQQRFPCVHGPEFDGHQVDFDNLLRRSKTYQKEEQHICQLKGVL
ncbi:MAG: sulfide/dihydroorotate dehydrogenase-like FAD/NAD-binding protein [Candidatus Margulisiibacteriota bacterium]